MPELPEVETTLRGLTPFLAGQTLTRVEPRRAGLRRPFPPDLVQNLTGATITALSRRAKYGLLATNRDQTMVFHLGMSGRWRINPSAPEKHDHLILETAQGHRLVLHDPRRFGSVDLLATSALAQWPAFAAMGPEPLGPDFTPTYLAAALARRHSPIKLLLLDQQIVAGLGNIYVCEALFRAGINPWRAGATLTAPELERLVPHIVAVLSESIAAGGSTIRDYTQPDGQLGYFAANWQVYGRDGQACPACATPIARAPQGGRSSFFCPQCQS